MQTAPFTSSIGFRQASVLLPSMFIAQEPQMPSRHDRRMVRVEARQGVGSDYR